MDLIGQATIIMVIGMAVTSAFLGIVIAGVNLSARIIRHAGAASPAIIEVTPPPPTPMDNGRIVAVIAAALLQKPQD